MDLSSVIGSSHFNYNRRMPEILSLLALDDCSKYIGRGDPRVQLDSSARFSSSSSSATATVTSNSSVAGRDGGDVIVVSGSTIIP